MGVLAAFLSTERYAGCPPPPSVSAREAFHSKLGGSSWRQFLLRNLHN